MIFMEMQKKILTAFNDMITDILSNNILQPLTTELFIESRKINIYLAFIVFQYQKI